MSIYPGGKVKTGSSSDPLATAPTREVFIKDTDGTMKGTGMIMLDDNTLLAPEGFGAESGSINFGDLITLSEASGFLAIQNNLNGNRYRLIDHYVPRDAPSSKPGYIQMIEAEQEFNSQPDQSTTLTTNPLIFSYTTQLTSRVNSIKWRVASRMTNVRFKITKTDVNVAVKYYPSKSAWSEGVGGVSFEAGDHVTDFQDTPLLFTPGTTLQFEVRADNVALKGNSSGIASFSAMVQRGEFKYVAIADDISAANIKASLETLQAPNKLSKAAIQDSVNTVNGQFGDVTITANSISSQPVNTNLTSLANLTSAADKVLGTDSNGAYAQFTLSPLSKSILASNSGTYIQSLLGVSIPTNVSQLVNDAGYVTSAQAASAQVNADWASVSGKSQILNKPTLFSGAYADLTGKPVLFSGSYTDLTNKPTLFDGTYASLTGKPTTFTPSAHTHVIGDVTGLQTALDSKIAVGASIPYSTLTGTPTIPAAQVQTDWNAVSGLGVLLNKPTSFTPSAHTQAWSTITATPTTLSGYGITDAVSQSSLTTILGGYATTAALTSGLATKFSIPAGTTTQYVRGDGSVATFPTIPTVPTVVSAFTNDSGYLTSASLPIYRRSDNTVVAAPIKVKYYTAVSDATSVWTVSLGTDFTEVLDVQVQPVSVANTVTGVRSASLNAYTSTSTTITGTTYGNNVLTTVLVGVGANTLALVPSTTVRLRVEGK